MRTIPPYLVALFLVSLLTRQIGTWDFVRYLFYVQNLFRQSNTNDYFAIAWSLSVEEWFYITFPALLMAAAFVVGRRNLRFALGFAIVFCTAIAAARFFFGDLHDWGSEVRRVVVFRVDSIGYGFLLYLGVEGFKRHWLDKIPIWSLACAAVAMTVITGAMLDHIAASGDPIAEQTFPFAAALFGSALILFAVRSETLLWRHPLIAQFGSWLGRISYSTYLFHIILIELIVAAFPRMGTVTEGLLFLAVLFTFTTAFYAAFERPILARRPRYTATE
jgi:peptidoglycan/LPS O-acetylase OafA/YrhL